MKFRNVTLAAAGLILAGSLATLWLAAPLRLAAPSLFGMVCADLVCVETPGDLAPAKLLVEGARADIAAQTGLAVPRLNTVLCRTEACYRRFGGGAERAISYPYLGMLVAGQSWQTYIIRHELIHWLQFEHFGAVETMSHPIWFREGMAYALSGAPDWDIPGGFRPWMAQFRAWQGERPDKDIFATSPELD